METLQQFLSYFNETKVFADRDEVIHESLAFFQNMCEGARLGEKEIYQCYAPHKDATFLKLVAMLCEAAGLPIHIEKVYRNEDKTEYLLRLEIKKKDLNPEMPKTMQKKKVNS